MSASDDPPVAHIRGPGDPILLREVHRGRIWMARPATVAAVRDDLTAVYLAPGTTWKVPAATTRADILRRLLEGWVLTELVWARARVLYLLMPDVSHAIHLWWTPPDWRFGGWYVNLQDPIRPTPLGFDYMDHMLDIVIEPDLSWRWKDEDEFAEALEIGLMSRRQADAIRAEGERVVERLEARRSPFCDGWEAWQPDPSWPVPELPDGWDEVAP